MTKDTEARITYGFWGLVAGAAGAMIIGFNWGGWSTAGTAEKMNEQAVLATRAEVCVGQFMNAPNHETTIKEFQGTDSYKRSDLIEKGGWDKMPGQDKALYGVSSACVTALEAKTKNIKASL